MTKMENIRHLLLYLEVVTEEQWEQASTQSKSLADRLDRLQQMSAWYSQEMPCITKHQRSNIERRAEKGLRDLDRDLRVNNYLLLDVLGNGGMGYVLKGWSLEQKRAVAIKRLSSNDPQLRDRLQREMRILGQMNFQNIVQFICHETVDDGDGSLMVMEHVNGVTLNDLLAERTSVLPLDNVLKWLRQLLEALEHAHSLQIIHRDLSWKNVMLTRGATLDEMNLKLVDFGLSKHSGCNEGLTLTGQTVGTPPFMSPEQFDDSRTVTEASDIYSLGCVAFAMLTGNPPFSGTNLPSLLVKHTRDQPPRLSEFRNDVPPEIERLVYRMLAKSPTDRGTASELIRCLNNPGDSKPVQANVSVRESATSERRVYGRIQSTTHPHTNSLLKGDGGQPVTLASTFREAATVAERVSNATAPTLANTAEIPLTTSVAIAHDRPLPKGREHPYRTGLMPLFGVSRLARQTRFIDPVANPSDILIRLLTQFEPVTLGVGASVIGLLIWILSRGWF